MKLNIKQSLRALLFVPVLAFAVTAAVAPQASAANKVTDGVDAAVKDSGIKSSKVVSASSLVQQVTNALLFIIGAISVIMIIVGGIRYVISNGDASQITAAKNTILYAVIGLVIALLAYAIVTFVTTNLLT